MAGGNIPKIALATFGMGIFKGVIVTIIAAAATEPSIEKRDAFFLIRVIRADLLPIAASR